MNHGEKHSEPLDYLDYIIDAVSEPLDTSLFVYGECKHLSQNLADVANYFTEARSRTSAIKSVEEMSRRVWDNLDAVHCWPGAPERGPHKLPFPLPRKVVMRLKEMVPPRHEEAPDLFDVVDRCAQAACPRCKALSRGETEYYTDNEDNVWMSADKSMPGRWWYCLLYTSPSPRDGLLSRMPSSA